MIFVEFYEGQGLGNQLWCYAAGRAIAKKLSVPFQVIAKNKFKANDFLHIQDKIDTDEQIEAIKPQHIFYEKKYYDVELDYFSSGYDANVLNVAPFTKLEGLYQSENYFYEDFFQLVDFFPLNEQLITMNSIDAQTCVINLRGGEYKRHKQFILPESYWQNAINHMKQRADIKTFIVVTDDERYAKSMFPNFEIVSGDIGQCYATLYNAKHLIVSNSTFSYFPIKTGRNALNVIAPMYWARHQNSLGRWASVANIYRDWFWLSPNNELKNHEQCQLIAEQTGLFYEKNYNVLSIEQAFTPKKLNHYFPSIIKIPVKKILAFGWPRTYG